MTRLTGTRRKKYSHNGCKECKRRKIKCDEGKPICWHCDRLDKSCQYQQGESRTFNLEKDSCITASKGVQSGFHGKISGTESLLVSPALSYSENETSLDQLVPGEASEAQDSFMAYWTPLLANDLSGLVNSTLNELTAIAEPTTSNFSLPDGVSSNSSSPIKERVFRTNVPLSYISLTGQNHFYMKEFYNEFSKVILPFQANVEGTMINPVRDVLMIYARESHYLLYALLACGARSSHRKSSLSEDQSSYKHYLTRCLETLTHAMERDMLANVDSILLTILVLTCDSASHTRQEWRTHLRGAKDLLLKNDAQRSESMIFVLCKSWYSSIEILAGLVSPNGGTLKSSKELDLLIICNGVEEVHALRKLNIVSAEGFSLFHGYSTELVTTLKDLIKLLRRQSRSRKDYCRIIDLISSVKNQLDFQVIDKSCFVPNTHRCYPKEMNINPTNLSNNIGITYLNGQEVALSWFDVSHRSYALAALITIFTKLLNIDKEDEIVQGMTKDLIETACLIDGTGIFSKSYCSFLLQWPMLVAGTNSIQEDDKTKVETFFRLLAQLGSGSAGFVLARLRKIWLKGPEAEKETHGEIDIVTY